MPTVTVKKSTVSSGSLRAILAGLLISIISTVVCLILLEAAFRVIPFSFVKGIKERQSVRQAKAEVHPKGLYTMNSAIGWTLTPGFKGRFIKEGFDILVDANEDGLRDHSYGPKPENTLRILGLGDSFAFGWGVEREESFYKVLETRLNNAPGEKKAFEVINAGIPGFGTFEAVALAESIGLKYEPDIVIIAFYEGNDYSNNGEAPRAREIREEYLADIVKKNSPILDFATKNSVLADFVKSRMASVIQKTHLSRDLEKTKQYLLDLKSVLAQKGIPFVLMYIPDQDRAVYTRSDFKWKIDRFLGGVNLMDARMALKRFCDENKIIFFRLSEEFEPGQGSEELRLKDSHFNAEGHRRAAAELYSFFKSGILKEEISQ